MGFFSNLGNALSGKTYKHNTLINSNVMRVYQKIQHLDGNDLLRPWVLCASAGISQVLQTMLFEDMHGEDGKDTFTFADGAAVKINPFKQHLDKLTQEKTFEFFKLTAGFFLATFLKIEDNVSLLQRTGSSEQKFKDDIFLIFEFNAEDKNSYNELAQKIADNPAGYFITLYKQALFATSLHSLSNSKKYRKSHNKQELRY